METTEGGAGPWKGCSSDASSETKPLLASGSLPCLLPFMLMCLSAHHPIGHSPTAMVGRGASKTAWDQAAGHPATNRPAVPGLDDDVLPA